MLTGCILLCNFYYIQTALKDLSIFYQYCCFFYRAVKHFNFLIILLSTCSQLCYYFSTESRLMLEILFIIIQYVSLVFYFYKIRCSIYVSPLQIAALPGCEVPFVTQSPDVQLNIVKLTFFLEIYHKHISTKYSLYVNVL